MLICVAVIAPASALNVYNGVDANTRAAAITWGGEVSTQTVTANTAEYSLGLEAHVNLAGNNQGLAYSKWSGENTLTESATLNGAGYVFNLAYDGQVNAGAQKKVAGGTLSADSILKAYGKVDNTLCNGVGKNLLTGYAQARAQTTNTGVGDTYAKVADEDGDGAGEASFDVYQTCPSCPTAVKEVYGQVLAAELTKTSNCECTDGSCTVPKPSGTITGVAEVLAKSTADSTKSSSESHVLTSSSAKRTKTGISTVCTDATGLGISYAYDGTTPVTLSKSPLDNANVLTGTGSFIIHQGAEAYNYGDSVTSDDSLYANAWHNTDSSGVYKANYNLAQNTAKTAVTGTRPNYATVAPAAHALSTMPYLQGFISTSRDNTNAKKFAQEYAVIGPMSSEIQLVNVWKGSNSNTLTLSGERNNANTNAYITNNVVNTGAPITGDSADFSKTTETIGSMDAKAVSGSKTSEVKIQGKTTSSTIDGLNAPASTFAIGTITLTGTTVTTGLPSGFTQSTNAQGNQILKLSYKGTAKS